MCLSGSYSECYHSVAFGIFVIATVTFSYDFFCANNENASLKLSKL